MIGRRRSLAVVLTVAVGVVAGVGSLACEPGADEHDEHDEHDDAGDEHAGPASAATAWVEVSAPKDASLIELPARVVASANSRAHLDVPFRAEVVSASVAVGDTVQVGDAMVELRVPDLLEAAAILAGARRQLSAHTARRDRLTSLREQGLVGAGEVFDVETGIGKLSADRRLALATLQAANIDEQGRRDLLRTGTITLTAPTAGVVADLDAVPGDVVEAGESLARVLGRGAGRVQVAYSGALPTGVDLRFVGTNGEAFDLRGDPVATAVEPGLGRTLAWYEPREPLELAHGVRGHVIVRGAPDASPGGALLEVPRRALKLHEGKAFVAREAGGAAEPEVVEVTVLRSSGASALIRSEALALGDRVAADAATVSSIGREADEFGGGHHH